MNILRPVNVLLLVGFLLYSVDTVYNAPARPAGCTVAETALQRNNAEVLDDGLYVTGKVLKHVVGGLVKNEELKFYENLEAVAKAAKSRTLRRDESEAAKALKEVLIGLAKDACTWTTNNNIQHTAGSGFEANSVDCNNVTDILRFARQQETDFLTRHLPYPAFGYDAVSLSLRMRPIITSTLSYVRDRSTNLQLGSLGERQAWVVRHVSQRHHCFVCHFS